MLAKCPATVNKIILIFHILCCNTACFP